jgi:hypothetical protein
MISQAPPRTPRTPRTTTRVGAQAGDSRHFYKHGPCRGTNRRGEPCGSPATASGFCYPHDPERAAELAEQNAMNAASPGLRRLAATAAEDELARTLEELRGIAAELVVGRANGERHPMVWRDAGVTVQLMQTYISSVELEMKLRSRGLSPRSPAAKGFPGRSYEATARRAASRRILDEAREVRDSIR